MTLHVVEAKLTRDTEFFGKMDPYVKIKYRSDEFKTPVKDEAGFTPVWNFTCVIDVKYIGDDIELVCKDKDVMSSDIVGNCTLKASALCVPGGLDDWFEIHFKGKSAGKIHLKS